MNEKFQGMMQAELDRLEREGLSLRIRTLDSEQGPACTIDGKYVVNLAANNYLGMIGRKDVKEAAKKAIDEFGVVGGYVAGTHTLVEYLKNKSRTILFSSTMTPADAGAILKVIDILTESDDLVRKLWENAAYFKARMKAYGFDTWRSETPITPIIIGDGRLANVRRDGEIRP